MSSKELIDWLMDKMLKDGKDYSINFNEEDNLICIWETPH